VICCKTALAKLLEATPLATAGAGCVQICSTINKAIACTSGLTTGIRRSSRVTTFVPMFCLSSNRFRLKNSLVNQHVQTVASLAQVGLDSSSLWTSTTGGNENAELSHTHTAALTSQQLLSLLPLLFQPRQQCCSQLRVMLRLRTPCSTCTTMTGRSQLCLCICPA
jgi:hypothetical protein